MIQYRRASVGRREGRETLDQQMPSGTSCPDFAFDSPSRKAACFRRPSLRLRLEPFRRLWPDGGKGAGQFGGANSLTHRDKQLICCPIG